MRDSVRGQASIPGAIPGAKSGLQCCQVPLKAASTNLCPGWTSQNGLTTGSALVKVSGHRPFCPFNMGAALLWERSIACLGSRPEGHGPSLATLVGREASLTIQKREIGPNGATLPAAGFQEPRMEYNFRGGFHWTRSPGA